MNDIDLLSEINTIIEEEEGNTIGIDDLITSSGMDSFGITMFILSVDDSYKIWTKEELDNLEVIGMTPKTIIERIKCKHASN